MTGGVTQRLLVVTLAATLLASKSVRAERLAPSSPTVTALAGASQKISHSLSASRDTALLAWQLTPYSALMAGGDVALVELGFTKVSLRLGFIGFIEQDSETAYDIEEHIVQSGLPYADVAFWRGHYGWNLAVAFDELGERWFGRRGLVETTLGFRHESDHRTGSNSGEGSNTDYSDQPHIGNFTLQDFAVRIPKGAFDFEFRLQNKLFFGSKSRNYVIGPGGDAIVRWRLTRWVHPFSSTFAEYLLGATIDVDGERARVPDNYLVRNLTGVIFPGRIGDIQVFSSVSVGHGKGLRVFQEELLWGGGVRLAFF
jgi:hypothetical protein